MTVPEHDARIVQQISRRFFRLRTVRDLDDFIAKLDPDGPVDRAFLHFALSWTEARNRPSMAPFDPEAHVSADLSAAMLGRCPTVFLGTNHWAMKVLSSPEDLSDRADAFVRHI